MRISDWSSDVCSSDLQLRDWRTIAAEARALLGVTSAVPLIEQPLMATYNGRVEGVLVRGMHANDIRTNATIGQKVIAGSLDTMTPGSRTVAIGARPAEALGVTLGRDTSLVSPHGQIGRASCRERGVRYV